jgi:hypothetical protein
VSERSTEGNAFRGACIVLGCQISLFCLIWRVCHGFPELIPFPINKEKITFNLNASGKNYNRQLRMIIINKRTPVAFIYFINGC